MFRVVKYWTLTKNDRIDEEDGIMSRNALITELVKYAIETGLVEAEEKKWAVNSLLDVLKLDA